MRTSATSSTPNSTLVSCPGPDPDNQTLYVVAVRSSCSVTQTSIPRGQLGST
jgi:hypothetical protein